MARWRAGHPVAHKEVYISSSGNTIAIACICPIGRDHSHAEWASEFAGGPDAV